jgi:hypothetical protein
MEGENAGYLQQAIGFSIEAAREFHDSFHWPLPRSWQPAGW